jgi:hypothetical protein
MLLVPPLWPNAKAQQPGGQAGHHVSKSRHGLPVCCSGLIGVSLLPDERGLGRYFFS